MTPQEQVVDAVKARGYWEGYSAYQMLARNLVKMAEELAEATAWVVLEPTAAVGFGATKLEALFTLVGLVARERFDARAPADWYDNDEATPYVAEKTAKELADMQVVLFNAAQAFGEWRGEPFDVVQAALDKSRADVARGVRQGQP